MLIQFVRPLYEDDDGAPGGGAAGRQRPTELAAQYHNDAMRLSEKLAEVLEDNYKLRDKNRTLTQERDTARGKAAPEGARMLMATEAAAYDAYVALGPAADLQSALTERDTLKQEIATTRRTESIRSAADAHGYKASALGKLRSLEGKTLETREVEVEGSKVKRSFVKDGTTETPLPDFLAANEADLLPALTVDAGGGGAQQPRGTPYPQQQGNNGSQRLTGDLAAQYIARQEEQRKAQTNALMPKP